jgi:uncharacterized protein (TIGR02246 family)
MGKGRGALLTISPLRALSLPSTS